MTGGGQWTVAQPQRTKEVQQAAVKAPFWQCLPVAKVQPALDHWEMQRLIKPIMRPDGMQRLAVMMSLLTFGSLQVYGCQARNT
jgi:hypothetical protein